MCNECERRSEGRRTGGKDGRNLGRDGGGEVFIHMANELLYQEVW